MIVHVPYLVLAIALLCFPRQWLRLGSIFKRRRNPGVSRGEKESSRNKEPGEAQVRFGAEFSKFRNYVDLLRAGAGSLAFVGGLGIPSCLTVAENAPRREFYTVIGIRLAIMLAGLLVQTVRRERGRFTFYPAIFYIAGLTVGLCGPWGALFAFVLVWAFNVMISNAQIFLTVYAVLIAIFGGTFASHNPLAVISAAILGYAPVLLSLLANRPLVIPSRKGTHPSK